MVLSHLMKIEKNNRMIQSNELNTEKREFVVRWIVPEVWLEPKVCVN